MGKFVEETSYSRRSDKFRNFDIGVGKVDYIDFKKSIIYETKKSSKFLESAEMQVKWYLYNINKNSKSNFTGVIEVPTERFRKKVILSDSDIEIIEEATKWIEYHKHNRIVVKDLNKRSICNKCSFVNYCLV